MAQQNWKPIPNTEQHHESTKILNLTVLQRVDPFVEEILITAPHVTFYEFNIDLHQWSRKDVEGSLFVVKRNAQPRFQFIVMNRRNTDNLVEDLLGDFEYDVQFPYLLYRNATQEVNAIWFYNEDDCKAVANLFSRILNAYSKVPPKPKVSSTKSEFEELEATQNLAAMEGALEPPASSAIPDVPDDSFVNFFTAAKINANIPNAAITGHPFQSSASVAMPSYMNNVIPTPLLTQQPVPSLPIPSTPLMPLLDSIESRSSSSSRAANLVKPSFFGPPISSSALMMPPIPSSIPTEDNVVVELCRSRAGIMYASNDVEDSSVLKPSMFSLSGTKFFGTVGRSINLGGQSALALRLLLAIFSSKISSGTNRLFGDEFRAARIASEAVGAQIVLGDRPIEITLKRVWSSLAWRQKSKLLISLFRGITSPSIELPKNNLKNQKVNDSPFQLYEQLSITYPSLLQPLIHERDTYLAWSLKRSKAVNNCKRVVGVIGKAHMNGVVYSLITDQGNLRFSDLTGRKPGGDSNGWVANAIKGLVRDTILTFVLWALYEQLKASF